MRICIGIGRAMDPMMVETRIAAPQRRSVVAVVRAPLLFFFRRRSAHRPTVVEVMFLRTGISRRSLLRACIFGAVSLFSSEGVFEVAGGSKVMTGCLLVGASYALLTTQTHAVGAVAAVGVEDSKVRAPDLLELQSGIH